MNTHQHAAATYKARAHELRAIADELTDQKAKSILIRTAEEYERMAERKSPCRPHH
jgi:hypothetical protein